MPAESRLSQSSFVAANGSSKPLYFNAGDHLLFGWLHSPRPNAVHKDLGVILCQPFGYEAICAHRGMRVFAESLAAAGMPALRFDYLGTGDSPEIDPHADQVKVWTQDVLAAARELRIRSGVKKICLVGFRLGALLAIQAAAQSDIVDALVLASPIASGRRYLKELRMTRMAGSLGASEAEPPPVVDGMEVSGFVFSPATLVTLGTLEVAALQAALPKMLVIESNTKSAAGGIALTPEAQSRTTRKVLPGLVEMLMTAPQFAQAPKEVIAATLHWLNGLAESVPPKLTDGPTPAALSQQIGASDEAGAANQISLAGDESSRHTCTERPIHFGPEGMLFGVLTQPPASEVRRRAVILLNAGADHHIGASRLYVSLARRWGQHGYTVLRMDFAGIGDSGTRSGEADDDVFPQEAMDDIRAAIDFLRNNHGIREITLAGLCSGAYHALRGAIAGLSVSRIIMVNPQNYFWRRGETLQGVQLVEVVHNPGLYRERVFSLEAWKRMITGQVNILRIIQIYLHRPLLQAESTLRDFARRLRIRLPNDLGSELEEIVARGVRVVFVFARDEPGIELLRVQAGNSIKRLGERCHIHLLESGDHVFTRSGARAIMENVVSDELFARPERLDAAGANLGAVGLNFE